MVIAFISSRPRPRSPGSPPRQGVRSVTTSTRGQLNCRSNSSGRGQISSSLCLMSDAFVVVPGGNSFRSATFKIPAHSGWENVRGTRSLVSAPHAQAGTPPGHPEDIALPICVEDGPGILQILREHHATWVAARKQGHLVHLLVDSPSRRLGSRSSAKTAIDDSSLGRLARSAEPNRDMATGGVLVCRDFGTEEMID